MIYQDFSRLSPDVQNHIGKALAMLNKLINNFSKKEMIITIFINPDNLKITDSELLGTPTHIHFKLVKQDDGTKKYYFYYLSN